MGTIYMRSMPSPRMEKALRIVQKGGHSSSNRMKDTMLAFTISTEERLKEMENLTTKNSDLQKENFLTLKNILKPL